MIKFLEHIDVNLLFWINGNHNYWLDTFMWYASNKFILIPVYLFTLYLLTKVFSRNDLIWALLFITIAITFTDVISTQVFKEGIQRYRPSHNLEIGPKLHLYEETPDVFYRGGQYGFFSSHAANYFAFLAFVFPFLKRKYRSWTIVLLALGLIVCYSRIYLGVHYPSDIAVGILFGIFSGWIFQVIFKHLIHPKIKKSLKDESFNQF